MLFPLADAVALIDHHVPKLLNRVGDRPAYLDGSDRARRPDSDVLAQRVAAKARSVAHPPKDMAIAMLRLHRHMIRAPNAARFVVTPSRFKLIQ